MQLAAHTYPFRDRPLGPALDEIAALGVGDVELWLGHVADPAEAAAALADRGLRAVAVSAGGFYSLPAEHLGLAAAVAREVGAERIVACVRPGLGGEVAGLLGDDLHLCVENHWDQPLARPGAVRRELEGGAAGACLDTGHALRAGIDPAAFAEALGDRLLHIHLKDAALAGPVERRLGLRVRRRLPVRGATGLDVAALRATLERLGYDGAVSVEDEGPQPELALASLVSRWEDAA